MENKTCGECRYMLHNDTFEVCTHSMTDTYMFDEACKHFAPPTNGDVIRQMSNRELAEFLSTQVICPNCPARTEHCIGNASKVCKKNWLAWLNAPADCVKQNGNHDTQADLCKADNTESEGGNEETAIFQTEEKGKVE